MTEQCKKYFQKISEYLDGELDMEICQKIRQHLQGCPECRRCLDSLRKTIDLCKEAGREKIPSDAQERLRSTLREFLGYE